MALCLTAPAQPSPPRQINPSDVLGTHDDDDEVPQGLKFEALRYDSFWYWWGTDNQGRKACLAAVVSSSLPAVCGHGDAFWPGEDVDDMVEGMDEQVTQDGFFKSSDVGHWSAYFMGFTSAIPDRDAMASAFEEMLRASGDCDVNSSACRRKNRTHYFCFDNEVGHPGFCHGYSY